MKNEKPSFGDRVESREDKMVNIPHHQLSPRALSAVIEEFITREGTDYGEKEVPLEEKILKVHSRLISGKALIIFDNVSETCTIVSSDDPGMKQFIKY